MYSVHAVLGGSHKLLNVCKTKNPNFWPKRRTGLQKGLYSVQTLDLNWSECYILHNGTFKARECGHKVGGIINDDLAEFPSTFTCIWNLETIYQRQQQNCKKLGVLIVRRKNGGHDTLRLPGRHSVEIRMTVLADPILQKAGLPQVAHGGRSVPASDSAQGGRVAGTLFLRRRFGL